MEINNYFNKTIMAILKNLNSELELHFNLKNSKEIEWRNYKIEIYVVCSDGQKKMLDDLSLTTEDTLFLDAFYEPEIPILLEGLINVVNNKSKYYSFSPIDDQDFVIELKQGNNGDFYYFSFFSTKKSSNILYGIRIKVNAEAINRFVFELMEESENI